MSEAEQGGAAVVAAEPPSQVRRIPIVQIRENHTALRPVDRKGEGYQRLLSSVKKDGVQQTILVREAVDPITNLVFYGLIDGLHRLTAAKDCGFTDIDVKVVKADDYDVLRRQAVMNLQRIETKPSEYSKQLARMLAARPMMTSAELAEEIGVSAEFINNRLGLVKLTDTIAKIVDEGKITLVNAYALAQLPADEQEAFAARAQTESPQEFCPKTKERLKQIREANRKGKDAAPEVFVPTAHMRKLSELKEEMDAPKVGPAIAPTVKTLEEAFALGVKWALHMDPVSIEGQKAKDESRKKEAADAAAKRKADREAKEKAGAGQAAVTSVLGVK